MRIPTPPERFLTWQSPNNIIEVFIYLTLWIGCEPPRGRNQEQVFLLSSMCSFSHTDWHIRVLNKHSLNEWMNRWLKLLDLLEATDFHIHSTSAVSFYSPSPGLCTWDWALKNLQVKHHQPRSGMIAEPPSENTAKEIPQDTKINTTRIPKNNQILVWGGGKNYSL